MLQNGYFQVFIQFLERLPVPSIPDALNERLTEHVLRATSGDITPTLESEMNDLVYDLYGLSAHDRALVGDWFESRRVAP